MEKEVCDKRKVAIVTECGIEIALSIDKLNVDELQKENKSTREVRSSPKMPAISSWYVPGGQEIQFPSRVK